MNNEMPEYTGDLVRSPTNLALQLDLFLPPVLMQERLRTTPPVQLVFLHAGSVGESCGADEAAQG